jgi:hypothetical protein
MGCGQAGRGGTSPPSSHTGLRPARPPAGSPRSNEGRLGKDGRFARADGRAVRTTERMIRTDERTLRTNKRIARRDERTARRDERTLRTDRRTAQMNERTVRTGERTIRTGERAVRTDERTAHADKRVAGTDGLAALTPRGGAAGLAPLALLSPLPGLARFLGSSYPGSPLRFDPGLYPAAPDGAGVGFRHASGPQDLVGNRHDRMIARPMSGASPQTRLCTGERLPCTKMPP